MVEMMMNKQASHWWWFDSHSSSRRSPWLQSTLAELDEKTKAMLKLIEEDADSFARRAEMYYKKRPELISMVEEFYRAHRSLAERYDQLKSDPGTRLLTTLGSPFSSAKYQPEKLTSMMDETYDSYSETCDPEESAESEVDETCDPEESAESEVDDPEPEEDTQVDKEQEVLTEVSNDEVTKLREEMERLKEENRIQKDQLVQKDEEKREVIRQLSLAVNVHKEENIKLRKCIAKDSAHPKKRTPFEFNRLEAFFGKLFNGPPKTSVVAL